PLQNLVNQEDLKDFLKIEITKIISEIGIDVNKVYKYDHLHSPFFFLLKPKIVTRLLNLINQKKGLKNRNDLRNVLENIDFKNYAGYLRVSKLDINTKDIFEPLDSTLIHPEMYAFFKEIAEKINEYKARTTDLSRKMLATVSELSMF
ncbi:MAG: hypothetical protein ACKO96_11750, partial [Flammeovirgaceae bacterium]